MSADQYSTKKPTGPFSCPNCGAIEGELEALRNVWRSASALLLVSIQRHEELQAAFGRLNLDCMKAYEVRHRRDKPR
jgi:hypothetical protein